MKPTSLVLTRCRPLPALLLAVALNAGAVTTPVFAQQPASSRPSAQIRYRHALEVFKQGKYVEARGLFLELWNEAQTYDVALELVQTEYQLGHYAAAANYLQFALANVPPTEKIEKTEEYKKNLVDLQGRTARVRIAVDQPSAEVLLDSEPVGTSPLASDIYVEPGPHTVEVRLGERKATQSVDAPRGSTVSVDLKLGAPASAESSPFDLGTSHMPAVTSRLEAPKLDHASRPVEGRTVAIWTGAGVTAIALGFGIGFALKSSSASDDAKNSQSQLAPGACASPAKASSCAALSHSLDDRNSANKAETISFAVAGVAAAATAAMFFIWPTRQSEAATHVHVVPVATLNTGGLIINGNF